MLAKKYRLPVHRFPAGAKTFYRGEHITLKTSNNNLFYNRVGVIVTRKTAPKATERNRLRRKIFDVFEEIAGTPADAKALAGKDLLVILKPIKLDRDTEKNLLEELNLIKERLTR